MALVTPFMQHLLGYPITQAGLMMVPRGLSMTFALFFGGRVLKYIDGRIQMFVGLSMVAFALWLDTGFTLEMGNDRIIVAGLIEGAGSGLVMTVLGYLAVSSAPIHLRTEASAMFTLVRNTGLSVAIAVFSALLVHNTQVNHAELGSVLGHGSMRLSEMLTQTHLSEQAAAMANVEITRQAMMIAYLDDFWLMMWALLAMLPVVLVLRPVRAPRAGGEAPIVLGE